MQPRGLVVATASDDPPPPRLDNATRSRSRLAAGRPANIVTGAASVRHPRTPVSSSPDQLTAVVMLDSNKRASFASSASSDTTLLYLSPPDVPSSSFISDTSTTSATDSPRSPLPHTVVPVDPVSKDSRKNAPSSPPRLQPRKVAGSAFPPSSSQGCLLLRKYRMLNKCQRILVWLALVLILLIIFNAILLTIGVRAIAEYAVHNWYPAQFDIQDFQFEHLAIGPMHGSSVTLSVIAKVPVSLPVGVRIRKPMVVDVSYLPPRRVAMITKSTGTINSTAPTTAQSQEFHSAESKDERNTPPEAIFIGIARMNDDAMELSNEVGRLARMNITLDVHDAVAFGQMTDHLLSDSVASADGHASYGLDNRNYSAPVVLQIHAHVSNVDVVLLQQPILAIHDISVRKTILLRDPTYIASNVSGDEKSVASVGSFFGLLSSMLSGDPRVLQQASNYMSFSQLLLYDAASGNPPPDYFSTLGPNERMFSEAYQNFANSTHEPPATSASNDLPMDPNSLPFSLVVTFDNPTNIQLDLIGSFLVQLNYTNVAIANVSVPNMRLGAQGSTDVLVFGYLRKERGFEHILEEDVPRDIFNVIASGNYTPLPFSISGISVFPGFLSSSNRASLPSELRHHSANETNNGLAVPVRNKDLFPPWLLEQPLQLAVQSVLSQRVVAIGDHYARSNPPLQNSTSVGEGMNLAKMFRNFPVLGPNGLGDMLMGLKLHLGWRAFFKGQLPISAWLANPFSCSIGIAEVDILVYSDPEPESRPIGWVGLLRKKKVEPLLPRHSLQPLVLLPPLSNLELVPIFRNGTGAVQGVNDTKTLLQNTPADYVFKLNLLRGIVLNPKSVIDQLTSTVKDRQFVASLGVKRLAVKLGRFEWTFRDITAQRLLSVPIFPKHVVQKMGYIPLLRMLFGRGWNLVNTNGINAFEGVTP